MAVGKTTSQKTTGVKKEIKKVDKSDKKKNCVEKNFEVDEEKRYVGKCVFYDVKRGFGFIKIDDQGVVPEDKVMVNWNEIQSDDRWPTLKRDMQVEINLGKFRQGKDEWVVKAKQVTLEGGEQINLQEEADNLKEYVGDKTMRYLGNVKFYDFQKGFGYVKLQDGYDVPEDLPNEFRIDRHQINSGTDAPRLTNDMEIEFGISKNKKGTYACYNITLPGGDNITRNLVEGRENITSDSFKGTVQFWCFNGSYGWIVPEDMSQMPQDIQKAIKKDHEKRTKRAAKKGNEVSGTALYFRRTDKTDTSERLLKGAAVTYKVYTDKQGVGACEVSSA